MLLIRDYHITLLILTVKRVVRIETQVLLRTSIKSCRDAVHNPFGDDLVSLNRSNRRFWLILLGCGTAFLNVVAHQLSIGGISILLLVNSCQTLRNRWRV